MGLLQVLDMGRGGMAASQTGLQVAGNNITNAQRTGYTRQRVVLASNPPLRLDHVTLGSGVRVQGVQQARDAFLEGQIVRVEAEVGFSTARQGSLGQVEALFGEAASGGISAAMDRFFNSLRDLTGNPGSLVQRAAVRDAAEHLAAQVNTAARGLLQVRQGVDTRLADQVAEGTRLAGEVARLNHDIVAAEAGAPGTANDLRDRRAEALRQLSRIVAVSSFEDRAGRLVVMGPSGKALVEGDRAGTLAVRVAAGGAAVVYRDADGNETDVTARVEGGSLGGLLQVRNRDLADLLGRLDHVAATIAREVNRVHRAGFGADGVGGRDLFVEPAGGEEGAALALALSADVAGSLDALAAAAEPQALPGDGRNAQALADLQLRPLVDGEASFGGYFGRLVADAGALVRNNDSDLQLATVRLRQLDTLRESVSGVSLDEEMVDLVRYQKAFAASARVVAVVDEMLDSLLGLVR